MILRLKRTFAALRLAYAACLKCGGTDFGSTGNGRYCLKCGLAQ